MAAAPGTGLAILLAYDHDNTPTLVVLEVDRSVRIVEDRMTLTAVSSGGRGATEQMETLSQALEQAVRARSVEGDEATGVPAGALRAVSRPRTSLPREQYLRAVDRVREHIRRGDLYQANLCQLLTARVEGDALAWWLALAPRTRAPRAAWFSAGPVTLASVSPEVFLRLETDGTLSTVPIKGTRPRHADPAEDRAAATALLASDKDRAELLMIVDLERNDLGRVCEVGSVHVPTPCRLESFATVHHLVAGIEGRIAAGVPWSGLVEATFPGGSITGAPKRAAMQLLAELEPVPRGYFTGSLFWAGDDGSIDSSILIRSATIHDGEVKVGAGGGIVTDSDPLAEWLESGHKARAITRSLGFDPEEAS